MNYTILSIAVLLVSIPIAIGEETELTISSPFNPQQWGCTVIEDTTDFKQFDCSGTWKSQDYLVDGEEKTPAQDGCSSGMDVDFLTGECKPFEIIQEEAYELCVSDPECPAGFYDPAPEADPNMPDETDPAKQSTSDKELVKKINEVLEGAKCYQGIGQTNGIQNIRNFEIPVVETTVNGVTVWTLDLSSPQSSVDLKGYLGQIIKHAHECDAQSTLLDPQGGVLSSSNAIVGFCDDVPNTSVDFNPICGKVYADHSVVASDVPLVSQLRVNQEANSIANLAKMGIVHDTFEIVEDVCEGYYTNTYKMTFKECRDIRDSGIVLSGGTPPAMFDYGTEQEAKVNQYKLDGGLEMGQEIAKQKIQEKTRQLLNQLRAMENQSP
jgi:hypothetical protein